MRHNRMGAAVLEAIGFECRNGAGFHSGSGFPLSGPVGYGSLVSAHDGLGPATGSLYVDSGTGTVFINEGTAASPYWTPISFTQRNLLGNYTDFRSGLGKALADTDGTATIADGTGVRVHGQGIDETDSGLVVAFAEGGPVATLTATNEDAHVAALSHVGTSPIYQPDTHGPLVVDANVSLDSALTLRRLFVGFVGTIADALDPPVTGSTVTITLVQDDVAGLLMDAGLTDAAGLFAPHNKSDEAASIATTATGVDTGYDMPAAGTYARLRVEITAAGAMRCFRNKVMIAAISAALDADEEVAPSILVGSLTTATKAALLKHAGWWGKRA